MTDQLQMIILINEPKYNEKLHLWKKIFFVLIVRKVKTQYLLGVYDILRKLLLLFIFFLENLQISFIFHFE